MTQVWHKTGDTRNMAHRPKKTAATISRYQDGWQYRGRYPDGKQFRRTGFSTKGDARESLEQLISDYEQGGHIDKNMTVGQWFDAWLIVVKETRRPVTWAGYKETVDKRLRPVLGNIRLADLNEEHIRKAYRELVAVGYSNNTILGTHRRLSTALAAAHAERRLLHNPLRNVSPPKGVAARERKTWTFEETARFSSAVRNERDSAMWSLILTSGLRRSEVLGLRWSRVNLDRSEILIDTQRTITTYGDEAVGPTKTRAGRRVIALSGWVLEEIKAWKAQQSALRLGSAKWEGGDYAFTTYWGKPYYPASLNKRLAELARKADVPVLSVHELRHTYASRALEDGVDIKVLSSVLGHSKVQVTMDLYQHVAPEHVRAATNQLSNRLGGVANS